MATAADDPLQELNELGRALRAQLEVLADSGCDGLQGPLVAAPPARSAPPQRSQAAATSRTAVQRAAASPAPVVAPAAPAPLPVAPRAAALDREQVVQRLQLLEQEARSCTRCGLHQGRQQAVFARGQGGSGVCFVGEGPGADEDAQGFPFVGKAGQLLDKMIVAMGLDREQVYVCNIVKCRPPDNRKPQPEEMAACIPFLHEQLDLIAPQVIVALGATAVQGLLGTSEGITRLRGKWKLYRGRIPVMPTFHPAYLLRQESAKREVWQDLKAVLAQVGLPVPNR